MGDSRAAFRWIVATERDETSDDRVSRIAALAVLVAVAGVAIGVGIGSVAGGTADDGPVGSTIDGTDAPPQIEERTELRLAADDPERIEATVTFDVPAAVDRFEFDISRNLDGTNSDVVDVDGFSTGAYSDYVWEGAGDSGSITVQFDRTLLDHSRASLPEPTADWAISVTNVIGSTTVSGGVDIISETTVAGPGTVGDRFALIGDHESYVADGASGSIELVVPEAADPAEDPTEIVQALSNVSDWLHVGAENDRTTMYVLPTDDVVSTADGFAYRSNAFVFDSAGLGTYSGGNTWFHEYVHTRQHTYKTTDETEWLVEGAADYYASALSLEAGLIDYEQFETGLERGTEEDDVVLADRETWDPTRWTTVGPTADYTKGALVVAAIDRQIRVATDGTATFQDVFREWNQGDTFDGESFEAAVEAVAGPDVRAVAERYTRTTSTPEPWTVEDHARAFDVDSWTPHVTTGSSVREALRSVDDLHNLTLVPGELIVVTGSDGVPLEPSDETASPIDPVSGTTTEMFFGYPDESVPVYTFEEPGEYEVRLGGHRANVTVREPAPPRVESFTVSSDNVTLGESVTARANVSNPSDRPTSAVVVLSHEEGYELKQFDQRSFHVDDGWAISTLEPGESVLVEATHTFDEPGTKTAATVNRSVAITVVDPNPETDERGGSDESALEGSGDNAAGEDSADVSADGESIEEEANSVPGFGFTAGVVGLVTALVLSSGRRYWSD